MALRTLQVARPRNSRGSLGVFVETWEVRKSGPSLGCAVFFVRRPSWHARWHESVEAVNSASAAVSTTPTNDTSISCYRLQFLLHMHAHLCRHLRPAHWMQCAGFRLDGVRVWPRPSPAVFLSFCPVVPARSQNSCFMRQVHICFQLSVTRGHSATRISKPVWPRSGRKLPWGVVIPVGWICACSSHFSEFSVFKNPFVCLLKRRSDSHSSALISSVSWHKLIYLLWN